MPAVPAMPAVRAVPVVPASPLPVPGPSEKNHVTSTPGPTRLHHLPPAEIDLSTISDDEAESE